MAHRVTLIEGDGIGPEITSATLRVLAATGVDLQFDHCRAGAAAQHRDFHPLPASTIDCLLENQIGLKGPLIVPRGAPPVYVAQLDDTYATTNAALRGVCAAFANLRPAKSFPGVPGRYADQTIDLVIVREISEGIYIARERQTQPGRAEAVSVTTSFASQRIARFAFELAVRENRQRVTAIHKANVLDKTDGLFVTSFYEVADEYSHIQADDLMIDAAAAKMVLAPQSFDVIVAPNQYGDILSDMSAAVVGGLGLGPGANYGDRAVVFEACHGAATDIAGKGVANPVALILSAAMLLDHLGEQAAALQVRTAVAQFFEQGHEFTPDLSGSGTTLGVAQRIIERMESSS